MKYRKGLTKEIVGMKADKKTYSDIAKIMGVSRQRVQQLFVPPKQVMIEVSNRAKGLCEGCGQFDQFGHYHHKKYDYDVLNEVDNIEYLCCSCHLKKNGEARYCLNCNKLLESRQRGKFCSKDCSKAYHSITAACSQCGKVFTLSAESKIRVSRSVSGLLFCSRKCQGLYLASHHGFKAYPEHAGRKGPSKYLPLLPEIIMRERLGQSLNFILRNMEIPHGSGGMIKNLIMKYKSSD